MIHSEQSTDVITGLIKRCARSKHTHTHITPKTEVHSALQMAPMGAALCKHRLWKFPGELQYILLISRDAVAFFSQRANHYYLKWTIKSGKEKRDLGAGCLVLLGLTLFKHTVT